MDLEHMAMSQGLAPRMFPGQGILQFTLKTSPDKRLSKTWLPVREAGSEGVLVERHTTNVTRSREPPGMMIQSLRTGVLYVGVCIYTEWTLSRVMSKI